jgi:hypothetical protein
MKRFAPALAATAACLLAALPAWATSYVMVSDEDLTDQAAVVVEARVLSVDSAPTERIATDYLVEVERVVKGSLPGSNLIVRVPGGFRPDGTGRVIWGSPDLGVGERPVLFLRPHDDGTWGILHLMLGAFRPVRIDGRAALARDLSEAAELEAPGESPGARARYHQPRERAEFVDWVAERARGGRPAADYFVEPQPGLVPVPGHYSFFTHQATHLKMRWFDFNEGGSIPWRVGNVGQEGLTLQQTINAFMAGQNAWNGDAATNVAYTYNGTTGVSGGLSGADGVNSILFQDPNGNDDFEGPFSCNSGGVLAIGGPYIDRFITDTYNGETFHPIFEGDIETNKNLGCFFASSPNATRAAEELFGHELGHTLGLGHSCDDPGLPCDTQALMYDFIHDDSRGAALTANDRAGLAYLYSSGNVPDAPSGLVSTPLTSTSVQLVWQDNSDDEENFRVERKVGTGGGGYSLLVQLPANSTSVVDTTAAAATTYSYRVRSSNAIGTSGASNVVVVTTPSTNPPAAPTGLTAVPGVPTGIQLGWNDNASDETAYAIERSSPSADFEEIVVVGPNVTTAFIPVLEGPYTFRVRARRGTVSSGYSNEASATPRDGSTGPCVAGDRTLCLLGNRFEVKVEWRNQHLAGDFGVGHAEAFPGSAKSGTFWFFNPNNVELIVKALDGRPVNGNFWLFYGALSDVQYWITVVDTGSATRESRTYHNPPSRICGFPDTSAFPDEILSGGASSVPLRAVELPVGRTASDAVSDRLEAVSGAVGTCAPGLETLCLLDGRFELSVDWHDQHNGNVGTGKAVPGTDRTGYFWFFNSQNIELVTKVLDNSAAGGNFWFFYGALSDVEYTITVRDTVTDVTKSYHNSPGEFCGRADTDGFPSTLP